MADTTCQIECEDWIRREWMGKEFGEPFYRERVRLTSGGVFDFDAVNRDGTVVATISTSGGKTSSGKLATGGLMKLRSDMLFLTLAQPKRALLILTERQAYDLCRKERDAGRVPRDIEFHHVTLPADLADKLSLAKRRSSDESLGIKPQST
jgi:hypothetical protein